MRAENRFQVEAQPRWAKLPKAPDNASPVPWLTSLYHWPDPGPYGDRNFPGNGGGPLIADLLNYFDARRVLDPMTGSGTCRDVCRELGIACWSADLHGGFDACDPAGYPSGEDFDFAWIHPPYWRMKRYTDDPRDLSQTPTLAAFIERLQKLIETLARVLPAGGRLAILMGDYNDRELGYVPLVYHTKRIAFAAGLSQSCTDIIRFSHGNTSSRRVYRSSFIPNLHDVCCVFMKPKV